MAKTLDMFKRLSLFFNMVFLVILFFFWASTLSISHFRFDFYSYGSADITDSEVLEILRKIHSNVNSIEGVVLADVSHTNGGIRLIVASGRLSHQDIDRKVQHDVHALLAKQFDRFAP